MQHVIHISTTLEKNLFSRVQEFCRREERSRSWLFQKAVRQFLDEMEDIEIAYERSTDSKSKLISSHDLRKRLSLL